MSILGRLHHLEKLTWIHRAEPSIVKLNAGNGHGSTNTAIRRFSNVEVNKGMALSLVQSAGNGDSVTVNEPGVYLIQYSDQRAAADGIFGISKNSSELTTSIGSITAADRLGWNRIAGADFCTFSVLEYLLPGDVIRPHTDTNCDGTTDSTQFLIARIL